MDMDLRTMIERFFAAELSVEEEQALCRYLIDNEVPVELQKDKHAIIALCGMEMDDKLPQGATERLESMLDSLDCENEKENCVTSEPVTTEKKRILKVPRLVWAPVAAAVILLLLVRSVSWESLLSADSAPVAKAVTDNVSRTAGLTPELLAAIELDESEEDTFDNPEEAMQCAKVAFGRLCLAINTTQNNAKEIAVGISNMINGVSYKK